MTINKEINYLGQMLTATQSSDKTRLIAILKRLIELLV
jgi:hypothetical protein